MHVHTMKKKRKSIDIHIIPFTKKNEKLMLWTYTQKHIISIKKKKKQRTMLLYICVTEITFWQGEHELEINIKNL